MERLTEWKDDKKLLAKAKFSGDFGSQNILQSLAEYEDLEELIGIPLENLAEICNNKIPEECRNPKKAIVLTDEDADRWNEYKSAEEQGLLLRLPCPIETEVWEIEKQFWIDRKGCKDCIYFGNDGLGDYCDYDEDNYSACTKIVPKKFNIRMLEDFGKSVFLTREGAEQKLKEMESD